ncbi:MAG: hypothetical protein M9962_03880 [Oligoflexia bacterium]|nr:hypothetical protein [Oligoflexia bacterium]
MNKYYALLLLIFSSTSYANSEAKSLTGRLGLGFTQQIATIGDAKIPAISAKYYLSRRTAFSVGTGFDTKSGSSTVAVGSKFFNNLHVESNLFFYAGAGLAYVSHKGSKIQGSLFIGSEFFFDKVPSVGFSFEAGVRGDSINGSFAIKTIADSIVTGGMHFYF